MKPLIAIIANQYDFAEKVFHNHRRLMSHSFISMLSMQPAGRQ